MKTVVSFLSGFVLAIAVSAIAVETSEVGRYQISIAVTDRTQHALEAIIDTTTGEIIQRTRVDYYDYKQTRVKD